ncbi:hypothetical protein, partial [Sansalvadorimonas verongulae]|uniref:hypothetical protein n=1 Tax=Sansalvadorimonas verongulae TaxID=2172824 RepID=UPI0018AD10F5
HWKGQYDARESHTPCPVDLDEGFRLLETNPQRALTAAAALLAKHIEDPRHYARVVELKAQALFRLDDFDGCIRYVNSLPQDLQNIQGVMMAKAQALQANDHLTEALPLFQALYERDSESFDDKKTMDWLWPNTFDLWAVRII